MFKINYNDLVKIIKSFGYDNLTATVVADYLDECVDYELDLSYYLWNTLPYNVEIFETKSEAEEYIKTQLSDLSSDNYTLYECENFNGIYLEVH